MAPVGSVASRRLAAAAVAALDPDRPPLTPQPPSTGDATAGPPRFVPLSGTTKLASYHAWWPWPTDGTFPSSGDSVQSLRALWIDYLSFPVACLPSDDASGAAE